jgi:hypothetical protein
MKFIAFWQILNSPLVEDHFPSCKDEMETSFATVLRVHVLQSFCKARICILGLQGLYLCNVAFKEGRQITVR